LGKRPLIKKVDCDIKYVDYWYYFYKFAIYERWLVDNFTKYLLTILENNVSWLGVLRKRNNKCTWKLKIVLIKWDKQKSEKDLIF
jgi:hypothetical protein